MTKPDDIDEKYIGEAIRVAAQATVGWSYNGGEQTVLQTANTIARAIQSAANAAAPKVKPLVWWGHFAHTDMGLFYYLVPDGDGIVLEKILGSATLKSFHGTEHEAKAAAQADYEQRILSALEEPTP